MSVVRTKGEGVEMHPELQQKIHKGMGPYLDPNNTLRYQDDTGELAG